MLTRLDNGLRLLLLVVLPPPFGFPYKLGELVFSLYIEFLDIITVLLLDPNEI